MPNLGPRRKHHWLRILGRLQRTTNMRRPAEPATPVRSIQNYEDAPSPQPTDPVVFYASRRTPTPRPPSPVFNDPTPGEILQNLLDRIDLPPPSPDGRDVVGDVRARLPTPPPRYYDELPRQPPTSPCSETATTYVEMSSNRAQSGSSVRRSFSPPSIPAMPRLVQDYDNAEVPRSRIHIMREHRPIPQGSPPLRPPRQVLAPAPPYYRGYTNPFVYPAYTLICHYSWYIQVSPEVIICSRCATDEHTFCSANRQRAVWRHLHVIARDFQHTNLHCGRCYKLLLKTRRAIDCLTCRKHVISMQGRTEHLVYRLLCETSV